MKEIEDNNSNVDDWLKKTESYVDPTWKRLGFPTAPDMNTSGKGVGIIILDDIVPHVLNHHLVSRLKQVKVDDNYNITCTDVASNEPQQINRNVEHGMMVLQLLTHLPFNVHNNYHVGLAPAANFIMLSEVEPIKIEAGLKWILQNRDEWNIQILLNLMVPNTREIGSMKNTLKDPFVQAMEPAVQSGLLIVAANGNTKAHNNLHPIHFFTVGGYDDNGISDLKKHKPHPAGPWGKNGDGHIRPDILAPFTYLPIPYCEPKKSNRLLSYFGGSCGAATLVTGICAYLLSKYPHLDHDQIKSILMNNGVFFLNEGIPAPKIDVGKVVQHISEGSRVPELPRFSPQIEVKDPEQSFTSSDPVERASALTDLIENGKIKRKMLWHHLNDDSSIVRKTVISYGLGIPKDENERTLYWKYFDNIENEIGERISWLYQLLFSSNGEELDRWIGLIKEKNIEINLCVKIYLEKHYKDSPEIQYSPDPNPDFILNSMKPVWKWYREFKNKKKNDN